MSIINYWSKYLFFVLFHYHLLAQAVTHIRVYACRGINDMKLMSDFFFQALITRLAGTVMTTLTYEPREPREDFIVSYLRYQLAPVMCNAQVSACISAATRQFLDLKNNNETYA